MVSFARSMFLSLVVPTKEIDLRGTALGTVMAEPTPVTIFRRTLPFNGVSVSRNGGSVIRQ